MGGGVIGALLVGVLLLSLLPAEAATGDPILAGKANRSGRTTILRSNSDTTLRLINTYGKGGTALYLEVPPGVPPMRVNRPTRVPRLNADRVDGYHADQLVRVAYASTPNAIDYPAAMLSKTITAPTNGYLVVNASVQVGLATSTGSGSVSCYLRGDATKMTGSERWANVSFDVPYDVCATTGVVAVPAGAHTVYFFAGTFGSGGGGSAELLEAALNIMFVPFDELGRIPEGFIL